MLKFRYIVTRLLWPMVFFLPFWISIGRGFLGSDGWGTVVYLLFIAPMLFGVLLVITLLIRRSPDFKVEHIVSKAEALLLGISYVSIFLQGFFIVDGGDTDESVNSVATHIFGKGFEGVSSTLDLIFAYLASGTLVACLLVILVMRFRFLRSKRVYIPVLVVLVGLTIGGVIVHYRNSTSPAAKDGKILYDFQLMSSDISEMAIDNNGQLPIGNAKTVAQMGTYGKQFHIADRAQAYTYRPLQQQKKFQLCAYFNTDTSKGYPMTPYGSDNGYYHHAGYQCVVYDAV